MSSNGPRAMYRLKPVYDSTLNFNEIDCMYKMKNICSVDGVAKKEASDQYEELEMRQLQVLQQLDILKNQVENIKKGLSLDVKSEITTGLQSSCKTTSFPCRGQDVVINASPSSVPYSVWVLSYLAQQQGARVRLSTHQHSSVKELPSSAKAMPQCNAGNSRSQQDLSISVIWKDVTKCEMMVNPLAQVWIQGETNIIRFLGQCSIPNYKDLDPDQATEVDVWLDKAEFSLLQGSPKERQAFLRSLNSQLGRSPFLIGQAVGVADLAVWSGICQCGLIQGLPTNIQAWWKRLMALPAFGALKTLLVTSSLLLV